MKHCAGTAITACPLRCENPSVDALFSTGDQLLWCSCCAELRSIRGESTTERDEIALQISGKTLKFSVIHWRFSAGLQQPCRLSVRGKKREASLRFLSVVCLTDLLLVLKIYTFDQNWFSRLSLVFHPGSEITWCSFMPWITIAIHENIYLYTKPYVLLGSAISHEKCNNNVGVESAHTGVDCSFYFLSTFAAPSLQVHSVH